MPESQQFKIRNFNALLRIDQLQLVPAALHQRCAGLGADADPIHPVRRGNRSVGFDGNLKIALVQRGDQLRIQLQQRFATGADDEALA